MRNVWTLPRLREAAKRWGEGENWSQIGASHGVSGSCVRTLVARNGIPLPKRKKKCNWGRNQTLFEAARLKNTECWSWPMIAEAIGWDKSPQALYKAVKRLESTKNGPKITTEGYPKQRKARLPTTSRRNSEQKSI